MLTIEKENRFCSVHRVTHALVVFLLSGMLSATCSEDTKTATPEQIAFFEQKVQPLLTANCNECHGDKKAKGALRLNSRQAMLKGGQQGPAINSAHFEQSLLLEMISYKDDDHQMPPKAKLPPALAEILTQWVKMGAPWPVGNAPKGGAGNEPATAETPPKDFASEFSARSDWWAYHPLLRPAVPEVKNKEWAKNPIDSFILAKLEHSGLSPVGPAEKIALIRRAYYDLTGLPPTPAEVDAFVADANPNAYEKLIDRLLESPHYGEKWGRNWLDLVRYAETNGYERDGPKPFAWRYRDYVIKAFNDDKPYDRFIKEQIAGDELDDVTTESLIATGYYRLGIWDDEPADRPMAKYDVLDSIVSTTCQTMLGMTVNCARCHDHKRDPISQKDYYSMLAFFQDITESVPEPYEIITPVDKSANDKKIAAKALEEEHLMSEMAGIEREFRTGLEQKDSALSKQLDSKLESAAAEILPDSRKAGQVWSYATSNPNPDTWQRHDYDDKKWNTGEGGFGTKGTPGGVIRTVWNTPDIWMRRKFEVLEPQSQLTLTVHHDEDIEVYINGKKVFNAAAFLTDYIAVPLDDDARKLLVNGANTIAVHCHNTVGGQYVDVGLTNQQKGLNIADVIKDRGVQILGKQQAEHYAALKTTLEKSRKAKIESTGFTILAVKEKGRSPTHILARGNPNMPGEEVKPAFPSVLKAPAVVLPAPKPGETSSGRRRILAEWLASKENRMTPRVMANRLWQYHFGRGLCRSSNDFGRLGELPTHPELMDWLACEFMERGWKLKSMHKLIMMSAAYQMSSQDNTASLAKDPANDLFWRFDMRRLGAEEIRDSILSVNGTINMKMGGPSIYPEMPLELLATSSHPNDAWGKSPIEEQSRRSVYIYIKRSMVESVLQSFDMADTDASCPVRFATTVPTQALSSLNSKFFNLQAAALARRLRKDAGENSTEQVKLAFRLALLREPTAQEIQRGVGFINRLQSEDHVSAESALNSFCLLVLNLNEFVYLD